MKLLFAGLVGASALSVSSRTKTKIYGKALRAVEERVKDMLKQLDEEGYQADREFDKLKCQTKKFKQDNLDLIADNLGKIRTLEDELSNLGWDIDAGKMGSFEEGRVTLTPEEATLNKQLEANGNSITKTENNLKKYSEDAQNAINLMDEQIGALNSAISTLDTSKSTELPKKGTGLLQQKAAARRSNVALTNLLLAVPMPVEQQEKVRALISVSDEPEIQHHHLDGVLALLNKLLVSTTENKGKTEQEKIDMEKTLNDALANLRDAKGKLEAAKAAMATEMAARGKMAADKAQQREDMQDENSAKLTENDNRDKFQNGETADYNELKGIRNGDIDKLRAAQKIIREFELKKAGEKVFLQMGSKATPESAEATMNAFTKLINGANDLIAAKKDHKKEINSLVEICKKDMMNAAEKAKGHGADIDTNGDKITNLMQVNDQQQANIEECKEKIQQNKDKQTAANNLRAEEKKAHEDQYKLEHSEKETLKSVLAAINDGTQTLAPLITIVKNMIDEFNTKMQAMDKAENDAITEHLALTASITADIGALNGRITASNALIAGNKGKISTAKSQNNDSRKSMNREIDVFTKRQLKCQEVAQAPAMNQKLEAEIKGLYTVIAQLEKITKGDMSQRNAKATMKDVTSDEDLRAQAKKAREAREAKDAAKAGADKAAADARQEKLSF